MRELKELYIKSRKIALADCEMYKNTPIYIILKQRQEFARQYIDNKIDEKLFVEFLTLQDEILRKEFIL